MEITYLGHACFKLKNKKVTVIIDPYDKEVGLNLGKQMADIVVSTHAHKDHSSVERIEGIKLGEQPMVIDKPGEYEAKGVSFFVIEAFHDDKKGEERGKNLVVVILMDGVSICHVGDLGSQLDEEQINRIGEIDILMCPVGGHYTVDAKGAIGVMNSLEPKIFIPMHYRTDSHNQERFGQLAKLDNFNNVYGIAPSPVKKLEVGKDRLPVETEIVVFE